MTLTIKSHPCLSFLRVNTPIHPRHPLPLQKRVLWPLTRSRSHPHPALPKSRSLQLAVQSTQMRELPAASLKPFVPLTLLQQISLLNIDFLLHFHSPLFVITHSSRLLDTSSIHGICYIRNFNLLVTSDLICYNCLQ